MRSLNNSPLGPSSAFSMAAALVRSPQSSSPARHAVLSTAAPQRCRLVRPPSSTNLSRWPRRASICAGCRRGSIAAAIGPTRCFTLTDSGIEGLPSVSAARKRSSKILHGREQCSNVVFGAIHGQVPPRHEGEFALGAAGERGMRD